MDERKSSDMMAAEQATAKATAVMGRKIPTSEVK